MNKNEVKRIINLSNDNYINELNGLLDKIDSYCKWEENNIVKMFVDTDYEKRLDNLLACRECGKPYEELDKDEQLWISSFILSNQPYWIWRESRPRKSGALIGESLKKLIENSCVDNNIKNINERCNGLSAIDILNKLSKEYNIKLTTINKIARCENWKWVNEELNYQLIN